MKVVAILSITLNILCFSINFVYMQYNSYNYCTQHDTSANLTFYDGIHSISHCYNLEIIQISTYTLPQDYFWNNTKLTQVTLRSSVGIPLREIGGGLFSNLTNLKLLDLSENQLIRFPVYEFPFLPNLQEVYLKNNSLNDLDVDEMFDRFSSLRKLYFAHNSIKCNRLQEVFEKLSAENIDNDITNINEYGSGCISSNEIYKIFDDTKLIKIRGLIENEVVKDEVKYLRETNKKLKENVTKVESDVKTILVNISEIHEQLLIFSNRIMDVPSLEESFVKVKNTSNTSSLIAFGILGLTLALAIVVGALIKCFITMRDDLRVLKKQEADKSNESRKQQQHKVKNDSAY